MLKLLFQWDVPYLIKMKGIFAVLISFCLVFRFCAVGETIDNLTYLTSQEIYSTGWFDLSIQHRKIILIFLCQAQATFDLSAYKVYQFRKIISLDSAGEYLLRSSMIFFREVKKLIKQGFGMENIFGYQTTLANQLYLMHIMSGRMYSTDKVHWHIKLAYLVTNFTLFCEVIINCGIYSIYGFEGDLILMTQVAFLNIMGIYGSLIVPLASCMFGNSIDEMIDLVDRLLAERRSSGGDCDAQKEGIINIRTSMMVNLSVFQALGFMYSSAGIFDVILFYEEEKVKNYAYYLFPFPYIQEYGSITFLLLVNLGIPFLVGVVNYMTTLAALALPLTWAAVCHNEVIHICHDLRVSCTPRNVPCMTKSYQRVARIIKNFREFYNILGTVTLVQVLTFAIANAYVVLLGDAPYMIKVKGVLAVFVSFFYVFQMCSVGETIDNLTNLISHEIYSTRWYDWSTQHRKNILIFLGQAQATFDLSAYKAYPFRLNTVLRFVNTVYSAANFLRTITKK